MRLKIIGDGTRCGTRVICSNGEEIENVDKLRWEACTDCDDYKVTITLFSPDIEIVGDGFIKEAIEVEKEEE